jgi:hypothetical protein
MKRANEIPLVEIPLAALAKFVADFCLQPGSSAISDNNLVEEFDPGGDSHKCE